MISDDPGNADIPGDEAGTEPSEEELRLEILRLSAPFAALSDDVLAEVVGVMTERTFAENEFLIRQGDAGDSLMVLRSGDAVARIHRPKVSTQGIAYFARGDIVGEMALLIREPRSADVVALSEVTTLSLATPDFERLASQYPELGVVLTTLVAKRLGEHRIDGLAGKRVDGRYDIVQTVGRGGMAVVYLAENVHTGDRVALKMMSHRLIYDPEALRRFQREAKILGSLVHPNIARMLERFSAFRTYFIVLEYCEGPTLETMIQRDGPLSETLCRKIVGQLASALEYLHTSGVLHRDLKPSNVLVLQDYMVKVTDFGLARHANRSLDTKLTDQAALLGTPRYLATEQFGGADHSHASDIYALGCIALEILLGESPFECERIAELVRLKATYEPPAAAAIGDGVSDEMHAFLRTALAVDPDARDIDLATVAAWAG